METVVSTYRNRWAYGGRLLNVRKTGSKVISPELIKANKEARTRLADIQGKPEVMAW